MMIKYPGFKCAVRLPQPFNASVPQLMRDTYMNVYLFEIFEAQKKLK